MVKTTVKVSKFGGCIADLVYIIMCVCVCVCVCVYVWPADCIVFQDSQPSLVCELSWLSYLLTLTSHSKRDGGRSGL